MADRTDHVAGDVPGDGADQQDQHGAAGPEDTLDLVQGLLRGVQVVDQVQLVDGAVKCHLVAHRNAGAVFGAHRNDGGGPILVLPRLLHGLAQFGRDDADRQLVRGPGFDPAVPWLRLFRHGLKDVPALDDRTAAFHCVEGVVHQGDDAGLVGDLRAVERVLHLLDVVAGFGLGLRQPLLEKVVGDLVGQVGAHNRERGDGQEECGEDGAELQRPAPPPVKGPADEAQRRQEPPESGPHKPCNAQADDQGAPLPEMGAKHQVPETGTGGVGVLGARGQADPAGMSGGGIARGSGRALTGRTALCRGFRPLLCSRHHAPSTRLPELPDPARSWTGAAGHGRSRGACQQHDGSPRPARAAVPG